MRDPSREPRPRSGRPSVWHDGARVAALPMHALGRGPGRHRARAVGASLAPGTASSRSAVARCVLGPERPAVARGVLGSGRLEVGRSSVQGAAVRARSALAGLLGSVRRFAMMTLTALAFCPMHAAWTDRSLADPRSCSPTPALAAIVRRPGHHRRSHVPARLAISDSIVDRPGPGASVASMNRGQFKQGRKHEQGATEDCRIVPRAYTGLRDVPSCASSHRISAPEFSIPSWPGHHRQHARFGRPHLFLMHARRVADRARSCSPTPALAAIVRCPSFI